MSEYYDAKNRLYVITESYRQHDDIAEAEDEVVAELFKIFGKK